MDKPELHTDVSGQRLAFDYWLVVHLDSIKKIFLRIFIVLDALLIIYSLWGLVSYGMYWYRYRDDLNSQLQQSFKINSASRNQPQDLLVGDISVLSGGHNSYDLVVKLKNPNTSWGITDLSYYLKYNSGQTATSTVTLGPNQEVYLSALGINSARRIMEPELVITNRSWLKIKANQDLNDLKLTAANPTYHPGVGNGRKWVTFTAKNDTTNNYLDVLWQVALLNGQTVVGYNNLTIERLPALSSLDQEISWFENIPAVTGVEVVPYLDVFDKSVRYTIPGQVQNQY